MSATAFYTKGSSINIKLVNDLYKEKSWFTPTHDQINTFYPAISSYRYIYTQNITFEVVLWCLCLTGAAQLIFSARNLASQLLYRYLLLCVSSVYLCSFVIHLRVCMSTSWIKYLYLILVYTLIFDQRDPLVASQVASLRTKYNPPLHKPHIRCGINWTFVRSLTELFNLT